MFAHRPIIGIAGGIGAGKSHVARLFEQLGCCRVDSDEMVRAAYTHPEVKAAVLERFGENAFDAAGNVDRKALAKTVFTDADARRFLEKLLHPIANKARVELMHAAARDERVVAFAWDSPLLFEAGLDRFCDVTVFVDCPRADRLARVAERGWDAAELDRREKAQLPLDKKAALAQYRLANAASDPATRGRVEPILQAILDRARPDHACGGAEAPCGPACACAGAAACASAASEPAR